MPLFIQRGHLHQYLFLCLFFSQNALSSQVSTKLSSVGGKPSESAIFTQSE